MEKKYQVFISSTFVDLKAERQKAIDTILSMNQFPAGMEMFSAADEEQWEIIKETINTSDFYVIIVGMKYGSVIEDGDDTGISYTEKEFSYALSQGVPVLAFVMANDAVITPEKTETDPGKMEKLKAFRNRVTSGRMVKFWHTADELAAQLSQSLYKAMGRRNRPGWVRTTDFNIEQSYAEILRLTNRVHVLEAQNADLQRENSRKPKLWVKVSPGLTEDGKLHDENLNVTENQLRLTVVQVNMSDAESGIDYKDISGQTVHMERDSVRIWRHICQNSFPLTFWVRNDGDARATGVRVKLLFPNELLNIAGRELQEYIEEDQIRYAKDAYEGWERRFFAPDTNETVVTAEAGTSKTVDEETAAEDKFIEFDALTAEEGVADLLNPATFNEVVSIYPGEVSFDKEEVRHKDADIINGVYVLPTMAGEFVIRCQIICNEYADVIEQEIKVVVE